MSEEVTFTGSLQDVDTLTVLLDMAYLVIDYRVISEGLPNAVMEAMACGVPVVATSDGGTLEILHDGVEGYLVARNDVELSADRILTLLTDESLRRRMGLSGRELIEKRYGLDACVARHESLYGELLSLRSASRKYGS